MRWREPVSDPIVTAFAGDTVPGLLEEEGSNVSEPLMSLLRSCRLVVANLESPLTTAASRKPRGTSLASSPASVRRLKELNVSLVNLANNHTMDRGRAGLDETLDVLAKNDIAWLGAGRDIGEAARPYVWHGDGLKIVFLSASYEASDVTSTAGPSTAGANPLVVPDVRKAIEVFKAQGQLVCLSYHGGAEFFRFPCPVKRRLMRELSGCGADMVIGHHAHLFQGLEIFERENRILAHGLGNFAMTTRSQVSHRGTEIGLVLLVEVDAAGPLGCSTHFVHNDRRHRVLELVRGEAEARLRLLHDRYSRALGEERSALREWRRDCCRMVMGLNDRQRMPVARRLERAVRNSWGAVKRALREGRSRPRKDGARHVCTRQEVHWAGLRGVPLMLASPYRFVDCYRAYDRVARPLPRP